MNKHSENTKPDTCDNNVLADSTSQRGYQAYFFPKKFIKKGVLRTGNERFKHTIRLCAKRDNGEMFINQERITEYLEPVFGTNEILIRVFKGKYYTKLIFAVSIDTYFEQSFFLQNYLQELEQFTS